jgi:gas vesicle protein
MNQESRPFLSALLLTLLGGASLGAAAVALTTPKTGKEVRNKLRTLGIRLMGRAETDGQANNDAKLMQFI